MLTLLWKLNDSVYEIFIKALGIHDKYKHLSAYSLGRDPDCSK